MSTHACTHSKDLAGLRVGKLVAVRKSHLSESRKWVWECRCDCGRTIERLGYLLTRALKKGQPSSCGCEHHLKTHGLTTRHGYRSDRRLNNVWKAMRQRCTNPNNKDYPRYGGRGIAICDAWGSFINFHNWAYGSGYRPGLTIERIDVNSGYGPTNCTWVPNREQALNWEHSVRLTFRGTTQGVRAWAGEVGLNYYTLRSRLCAGWDVGRALGTPVQR